MATETSKVRHDAKFSPEVLEVFTELELPGPIVDPFAGIGGIFTAFPGRDDVHAIEIEPEFAAADHRILCGDAMDPGFYPADVEHIVTSITYGNRMGGSWVGVQCKNCYGVGCSKCGNRGNDSGKRFGYAAALNRAPSEGSSALWTFGPKWQAFHYRWLALLAREILPAGRAALVLNCSNHYRTVPATSTRPKRLELVDVNGFMIDAAHEVGFQLVEEWDAATRRIGMGANRDARADTEKVFVFDLLDTDSRADRFISLWNEAERSVNR